MASSAGHAPSTGIVSLQIAAARLRDRLELWLETEREQLVLWLPVMLGAGIAAWFALPGAAHWIAFLAACGGLALVALALSGGRLGRAIGVAAIAMAIGCALVWWRAESVAVPVLERAAIVTLTGRIERVEQLPARGLVRLTLAADVPGLPPRLRVNLAEPDLPAGATRGAVIRLRARLMPPPAAAVPGAYDYAQVAWFQAIGATGRGFAPVTVAAPGETAGADLRARLSAHIQSQVAGSAGGIASALATGDRGAISEEDAEAMRRSGLAHLLSVSGLHVTAVTAAAMLIVLRLLALSPWLALAWRLPLVAAGAGALAAVGYTWLTGAEVPTIRSCIAALLVLLALSLGREAITLRLVAAGALVVLLLWPEALAGPSFQLSFAAVTAIVALHEHPRVRGWFARREEGRGRRLLRGAAGLLLTGVVVEVALMPIALFHFHQAGVYGALANIVAIPLTTFVIMPLEALALLLDVAGIGAPAWWVAEQVLHLLLGLAHLTAGAPGAVAALPAMPGGAFALIVGGGLWLALWRSRARRLGLAPLAAGLVWALLTPAPDLLVTGDGRHLAVRAADGGMALLRDRAGDYVRGMLGENGGVDDALGSLAEQPWARCSRDICLFDAGGRRIVATRSSYMLRWEAMAAVCRSADIVVSDRRLPQGCAPRWLKLDRETLAHTGGVAIRFADGEVRSVRTPGDRHPWVDPVRLFPAPPETGRR
ncbi:ComEC/Rec2 family competence protein [Sphingomonas canadensis]|uniref:ComEC/Rec2 family competence protein n=1 Tax=Sphingomonas canadensis TaxID=1219257 RepID=A0ABW3HB93_9SPHN|nr:ComEC/Rec2 family competence protein [Sphingomonas canadensis]MCW3837763.1 ComEC family competence protein [Sphingomonas canadensis]